MRTVQHAAGRSRAGSISLTHALRVAGGGVHPTAVHARVLRLIHVIGQQRSDIICPARSTF